MLLRRVDINEANDHVVRSFNIADSDGNGLLTEEELERYLNTMGCEGPENDEDAE